MNSVAVVLENGRMLCLGGHGLEVYERCHRHQCCRTFASSASTVDSISRVIEAGILREHERFELVEMVTMASTSAGARTLDARIAGRLDVPRPDRVTKSKPPTN